jgi:hypothetical protein
VSISKQQIEEALVGSISMAEAAAKMKIHFSTFKRYAQSFGLYNPNMGRKGSSKPKQDGVGKIPLNEILEGKHPSYQTYKLKKRLYKEGLKENKCEECGVDSWNGQVLECELDHVDGDRTNHKLTNLKVLCPNCHSQTHTFRFKRGYA